MKLLEIHFSTGFVYLLLDTDFLKITHLPWKIPLLMLELWKWPNIIRNHDSLTLSVTSSNVTFVDRITTLVIHVQLGIFIATHVKKIVNQKLLQANLQNRHPCNDLGCSASLSIKNHPFKLMLMEF